MNNPFDDMDKALHSGSKSAFNKDTQPGTTVSGPITAVDFRQVLDYSTQQPAFFPSGDPKMQFVISVSTGLREDADDDGERSIYVPAWGGKKRALMDALKIAGFTKASEAFAAGNVFTAHFVGEERKQGNNGAYSEKVYQYRIDRGNSQAAAMDQAMNQAPQAYAQPQGYTPAAQAGPWQAQPQAPAPQWPAPQAPAPAPAPAQPAPQAPTYAPAPAPVSAGPDPQQVQQLIRQGQSDQQVAQALNLDPGVVSLVRAQMAQA